MEFSIFDGIEQVSHVSLSRDAASLYSAFKNVKDGRKALGGAPESLVALNGGILALMDWLGVTNVAKQMRHFCAQPQKVFPLLLGKLSR